MAKKTGRRTAAKRAQKASAPRRRSAAAPRAPKKNKEGVSKATSRAKSAGGRTVPRTKKPNKKLNSTPPVAPARSSRPPAAPRLAPPVLLDSPIDLRARREERPLGHDDIEFFRQMLLEKRAEILGDVSTLHREALYKDRQDAAGDMSSMPIHMADLGTDNYELEFTLGLIEGERAILKEIDEALERIRKRTYGVCLATGKPIGKARLRAKPWAKYCYEYTLAQEKGRGHRF